MEEGRWAMDEGRGASDVEDQESEIKTDFRPQTSIFSRPSSERSGLPSSIGFFTLPITLNGEPRTFEPSLLGDKFNGIYRN
jgi:hypothetical protein